MYLHFLHLERIQLLFCSTSRSRRRTMGKHRWRREYCTQNRRFASFLTRFVFSSSSSNRRCSGLRRLRYAMHTTFDFIHYTERPAFSRSTPHDESNKFFHHRKASTHTQWRMKNGIASARYSRTNNCLREKEKMKDEHYKLKARIKQLSALKPSAFLSAPDSIFAGSLRPPPQQAKPDAPDSTTDTPVPLHNNEGEWQKDRDARHHEQS